MARDCVNPFGIKLGLIALLLGGIGMAGTGLYGFVKGKAADKQRSDLVISRMVAQYNADALKASEAARAKESELQAKLKGAQDALDKERATSTRIAADLRLTRTERDGLRDQIGAFAGGSGVSEDTISAARDRAATLGRLLDESLQLQEELAGDAEALAADVRALRQAWPD